MYVGSERAGGDLNRARYLGSRQGLLPAPPQNPQARLQDKQEFGEQCTSTRSKHLARMQTRRRVFHTGTEVGKVVIGSEGQGLEKHT